jgi:glycosyltransferase involved in cell wall biosynthesis
VREVLARHGIAKPYILFTSTIEPRKNILGLLEAYAALPQELRTSHGLVLVGGKGWLDSQIHRRLGELRHLDIRLTGYVEDRDLPALYSGASVFVYPSFYEGFGMPPLEAMACGVPVVTSRNSSLPEVVGDAGILIDPGDPAAITQAICEVLGSPARAADLSRRGLERSRAFRWDESARRLAAVFEEAAGFSGSS